MDIRSRTANSSTMFESLEPRLLLSSSPALIAEALDLPAGVVVAYTGDDLAAQDRIQYATGGLLGIPTGPDEDFLMLSTGDAAQIDTLDNEAESQGTDLGAAGEAGDVVTVQFTLPVPASEPAGRQQKLKLDFIFLTEEVQEWRGTAYNDYFKVTVNGDEIANLNINSALLDDTLDTTGTFFDSRTDRLTAVYVIPGGAATLDVTVELGDVGDGWYDSGVLLDNVRIEGDELVWLNFDGMDVGEHFGWGTGTTLPAFQPRDVRSTELRNTLIANILAGVEDKYADYDITFVTAQPASGDYSTVVIGGSGETMTHLEPILQTLKALPANVTLDDYYGQEGLLGLADGIDFGNVDKNSLSVVLSGEFENFGDNAVRNLTEVIAHELGHTLGLRHVTDDNDIMYPWWDFGREDFAGEDTFTYTIMDEDGLTDTATVTVLVGEPQEPYDDEAVIEKDSAPTAIDVLANDLHPDPTEVLTIESVAQPSHGTVEIINGGAELTYQPDAEYVGDDSFTYNVIDEDGLLAGSATVTITVMADEPIANDDGAEVLVDSGPVAVAVLDNDTHLNPTENLTITSVTQGANGTVVITGGGTGLTYEPDAAYTGDDEFTYTIEDEAGLSATATVSMDVGHVADAPTAYDDDAAVEQGSEPVAIDVLVNDTYLPDLPETLTIVSVTQGSHGEVVITGGGTGLTYQPDSLTFQDENMSLQEDWADGATGQNDYDYFADVLGLAGGGTSPVENHTAVTGEIIRTFNISFPSTLYNVTFGTTGSGQTVHFDTLNGTRHLSLPVYSPNDQVFLFASTRPDGRINVVSGTVVVDPEAPPQDWSIIGTLDYDGIMIDLYDGVEMIGEFPLAKLRINGTFEQILKRSGGVWNNKAVGISESRYYAAAGVDWLARNRGAFADDDGDTYNVALTGDGTVAVFLDDADGDGNGAIQQILMENTADKSKLNVSVRRARGAGDGAVNIGGIAAPELGGVTARASDLTGKGLEVDEYLGGVTIRDILNGAWVVAGGQVAQKTNFSARLIDDDSRIQFGSQVTCFTAAQVGDAEIEAPGIGSLNIKGDRQAGLAGNLSADVTLNGDASLKFTLSRAKIAGGIANSTWNIVSGKVGGMTVMGPAVNLTFWSADDVRTLQFGRLVGSNIYVGIWPAFTAEPGSDDELPNTLAHFDDVKLTSLNVKGVRGDLPGTLDFVDSNVAAGLIVSVNISDATFANGGRVFGFAADRIGRLSIKNPQLRQVNLRAPAQTIADNDFRVLIL